MADYNSMKVPELKKLLNERGLTQAGNKADLIARLVEDDKQKAQASQPPAITASFEMASTDPSDSQLSDFEIWQQEWIEEMARESPYATESSQASTSSQLSTDISSPGSAAESKVDVENEIDYDDDDIPEITGKTTTATAAKATATATTPAASTSAAPATSKPTMDANTAAPAASNDAAATTANATEGDVNKTSNDASDKAPLTQNLAPTNAKTEAEKRAARAARFGITYAEDSEEAKKANRAERFGVANDDVAALDSALPERPRKRGRGGEEAQEDSRAGKRQSNGPAQNRGNQGNQRNQGGRNQVGRNQPGRNNRQNRRGGAPQEGGSTNGQKKAAPAIDAAEKAKLEARAKRFATGA
ncbi:hypothetical protein OQA88_4949 [Cercophora sp. LCS_1]